MKELLHKIFCALEISKEKAREKTITNLAFLESMTDGNQMKMAKYIKMYIEGVPPFLAILRNGIESGSQKEIRDAAHSLIPMFHYMGAETLINLAKDIQNKAKAMESTDEISRLTNDLESGINRSYVELSKFLETVSAG